MQVGSELNKLQVSVHLVCIFLPSAGHKKGAVLVTSAIHIGRLQILPGPLKSIVFFFFFLKFPCSFYTGTET